ncbi:hypothetical protein Q7C_1501 [Methylophaga frappieri]|uniref:Uncharacterized protein n=1 Tax=Methylophaga frappieri (strain ATCC BAA-2434 / DSM 25690 / JAM7) TaxID=754477 RepID=I1YIA7_METFJ|nr:hypothetical protein Q7C_1501 [Methylophaga frappieri]
MGNQAICRKKVIIRVDCGAETTVKMRLQKVIRPLLGHLLVVQAYY